MAVELNGGMEWGREWGYGMGVLNGGVECGMEFGVWNEGMEWCME